MKAYSKTKALFGSLILLSSSVAQAHSADYLSLSAHWQAHLMLAGTGLGALFLLWLGVKHKFGKPA